MKDNHYHSFSLWKDSEIKNKNINFLPLLYIIIHLSIIIIFEIFFYFLYIIKKEYEMFNYLIDDITNSNNNTNKIIEMIKYELNKNISILDDLNRKALNDKKEREDIKDNLFEMSFIIIIFVILLSGSIITLSVYKKKVKLRFLIIDILSILSLMSIFEYIFFNYIISKIRPISIYELLNEVINRLENKDYPSPAILAK